MTESAPQRRATKRRTTTSRGPHRSVSSTHANQGARTSRGYRSAPPQDLGNVMAREVRGTRGDRPRQVRAAHQHGSRSRRYSPEMAQLRSSVDRRISDNRVRNVRRSNGRKNKFPFVPLIAAVAVLLVVAIVHDRRTRGRTHPVYIYGGVALIAVKLLNWPISATSFWHSFAGGILAMAQ
jgi:hypothetical protein